MLRPPTLSLPSGSPLGCSLRMSSSLFDLTNEVAVVIGATGVLGGALADGLAAAGAKIAVLGRNAERGQARVKAIRAAGGTAGFFRAGPVGKARLDHAHQAGTEGVRS